MKKAIGLFIVFSIMFSISNAQDWQWARGNTGNEIDGCATATDKKGNVFVAGWDADDLARAWFDTIKIPSIGSWVNQTVVAKYDSSGRLLWALGTQLGESIPMAITTDDNGDVYLFGIMNGPIQIGSTTESDSTFTLVPSYYCRPNEYFIIKFDADGHVIWGVSEGGAPYIGFSAPFDPSYAAVVLKEGDIAIDQEGNVYITTSYLSSAQIGTYTFIDTNYSSNILVAKYSPSGHVLWAKSFSGNDISGCLSYNITVTESHDIYIAGLFYSKTMTFGSTTLTNQDSTAKSRMFIARLDSLGNPVWADSAGKGLSYPGGLATDKSNNVYLSGGFEDDSLMLAGTKVANPNTKLYSPSYYLIKFNPNNQVEWYKTGDTGVCYSIATDICGNIWVSGSIIGNQVTFDGNILLRPAGSPDALFIAEYTSTGEVVDYSALSSGGEDQMGIAVDQLGNVFVASDYNQRNFTVGPDIFSGDSLKEFLYVAKYSHEVNCALSIKEQETNLKDEISLFPNPTNTQLSISASGKIDIVTISNLLGQTIFTNSYNSSQVQIDVSTLPAGLYFVKINGSEVRKFVKQ